MHDDIRKIIEQLQQLIKSSLISRDQGNITICRFCHALIEFKNPPLPVVLKNHREGCLNHHCCKLIGELNSFININEPTP